MRIGFAGMTHLGLVSASATASRGFEVVGFDPNRALIEALRQGRLPVSEPGLAEMIAANGTRQVFSANIGDIAGCDVVYIAPDVPTDAQGNSDLSGIESLIGAVIPALAPGAIMVVLCQVPPGFTRALPLAPERLFYQVETLVFGNAVERAMNPERFIIGCADPDIPLPAPYTELLAAFGCPVLPMRYESAELAKISINMCLVASIGVANTMAELCESLGALWSEVAPALRLDRRIGQHAYLAPGLGLAGGNLERDLATVIRLAQAHNTDAGIVEAWVRNSRHRRDWVARIIRATVLTQDSDPTVAVWGLAYKENTHSTKNSPALATIAQFPDLRLRLHDPLVRPETVRHGRVQFATSALDAATGADALAILTPWPEYRALAPADIAAALRGHIVIDPYQVLDPKMTAEAGLVHYVLGRPPPAALDVTARTCAKRTSC